MFFLNFVIHHINLHTKYTNIIFIKKQQKNKIQQKLIKKASCTLFPYQKFLTFSALDIVDTLDTLEKFIVAIFNINVLHCILAVLSYLITSWLWWFSNSFMKFWYFWMSLKKIITNIDTFHITGCEFSSVLKNLARFFV